MLSKLLRLLRYDRDRQVYLPNRMTPFRMRLSVAAFLAIATAISINAIYLQAPLKSDQRTGRGPQPPSGAAARARALITAALPGHEDPVKPASERQERTVAAPAVTMAAKEKSPSGPAKPAKAEPSPVVRALQKKLTQFGYRGLPQDGLPNPETRAAILAAEFEEGMPLSGEPGDAILKGLFFLEASGKTRLASTERFEANKTLVQEVQDLLAKLGYSSGPVDGQLDARTREAIRKFETDRRLKPDGRLGERILLEMVIEKGKPFLANG
jgi:peptidoglycan hydrolase-like protein with peptidoglycan-binding domain